MKAVCSFGFFKQIWCRRLSDLQNVTIVKLVTVDTNFSNLKPNLELKVSTKAATKYSFLYLVHSANDHAQVLVRFFSCLPSMVVVLAPFDTIVKEVSTVIYS